MNLRGLIAHMFMKARGGAGSDLSRGPLSDRIRDAAVVILSERRGGWVLEVGVGEGLLAREAVRGGITERFIGMDIDRDNLRRAQEKVGSHGAFFGMCGRGDVLPFVRSAFSRVICINTLHNQPSWSELESIVSAAGALVKEGGSLIFDIRNAWDPLISCAYRYSTVFDPSTKRLPVRAYRFGRVRRLLGQHGFRVVRKVGIYYPFWCFPSAFVIEARR
ncbi:MAG: class I SAM-dependent methyltransferase [Deltaproteobacteria bacterium]|nr:class I SAM-dependent methyltransferase [Candidatus Zymogenaceae bacterium]